MDNLEHVDDELIAVVVGAELGPQDRVVERVGDNLHLAAATLDVLEHFGVCNDVVDAVPVVLQNVLVDGRVGGYVLVNIGVRVDFAAADAARRVQVGVEIAVDDDDIGCRHILANPGQRLCLRRGGVLREDDAGVHRVVRDDDGDHAEDQDGAHEVEARQSAEPAHDGVNGHRRVERDQGNHGNDVEREDDAAAQQQDPEAERHQREQQQFTIPPAEDEVENSRRRAEDDEEHIGLRPRRQAADDVAALALAASKLAEIGADHAQVRVRIAREPAGGEQFALEDRHQHEHGADGDGDIGEGHQHELALEFRRVQPRGVDHHRQEQHKNLFREEGNAKANARQHDVEQAAIAYDQEVEREQQPEGADIVQQHLALIGQADRREREDDHGQQGGAATAIQAARNQVDEQGAAEGVEQHQHAPAIDGVAEGEEATGGAQPGGNLYPGQRRMAIAIGVGRKLAVQDGPGIRDVGAFVQLVARKVEHVQRVRDRRNEQADNDDGRLQPGWHGKLLNCDRVDGRNRRHHLCLADGDALLLLRHDLRYPCRMPRRAAQGLRPLAGTIDGAHDEIGAAVQNHAVAHNLRLLRHMTAGWSIRLHRHYRGRGQSGRHLSRCPHLHPVRRWWHRRYRSNRRHLSAGREGRRLRQARRWRHLIERLIGAISPCRHHVLPCTQWGRVAGRRQRNGRQVIDRALPVLPVDAIDGLHLLGHVARRHFPSYRERTALLFLWWLLLHSHLSLLPGPYRLCWPIWAVFSQFVAPCT